MRYLGGKHRIASKIAAVINAQSPTVYAEPFCGACWVGRRVHAQLRVFADLRRPLIALYEALMSGWLPPWDTVTAEMHKRAKAGAYTDWERGYILAFYSFGGDWNGGFARSGIGDPLRIAAKQVCDLVPNSEFICADALTVLDFTDADVIYCDPPYYGTTPYTDLPSFDYSAFWDAVRAKSQSCVVLVSEYVAPADFGAVLELPTKLECRTVGGRVDRVERLFHYAYGRPLHLPGAKG